MDDNLDSDNTELKPDENQLPEQETPLLKPENPVKEPESPVEEPVNLDTDPLLALRLNLLNEEPEPEVKQNLFHRFTGTLSLKKAGLPEPTFGVKTAGNPAAGGSEDMQDDFFQKRLGTSPIDQEMPEPKVDEAEYSAESEPDSNSIVIASNDANKLAEYKSQFNSSSAIVPARDDELSQEAQEGLEAPEDSDEGLRQPAEPKQPAGSQYRNPQRFIAYDPKQSFWSRIKGLNRIDKILILILILAVIALIGFVVTLYLESHRQQPALVVNPTPLATATLNYPVPIGLHLPGGWFFELKVGSLVDGKWTPQTSEWLEGTEIRRVIAIPWNKQVEAVIQTFTTGDIIGLDISNGDKIVYKVQSVSQVPASDSSVLYDTRPSLAIILINPDSNDRWIIIAAP